MFANLPVLLCFFTSVVLCAASNSSNPACTATLDGELPAFTPSNFKFSGDVRRYYIAAEEIEWDYAPTGWDNWLGVRPIQILSIGSWCIDEKIQVPFNESARAQFAGYTQYGTKWVKALYREYTDNRFTECVDQPPFQGSQGPTIRAEVGDMIEILFLNRLKKNYATMHSMGLAYSKSNEGSNYPNNTIPGLAVDLPLADRVPPAVGPGDCVVYKWIVNDPAGPAQGIPAKVRTCCIET
jgi:hypothetical protein